MRHITWYPCPKKTHKNRQLMTKVQSKSNANVHLQQINIYWGAYHNHLCVLEIIYTLE